jgi:hypothetical protein
VKHQTIVESHAGAHAVLNKAKLNIPELVPILEEHLDLVIENAIVKQLPIDTEIDEVLQIVDNLFIVHLLKIHSSGN